jgi:hypothetical protein
MRVTIRERKCMRRQETQAEAGRAAAAEGGAAAWAVAEEWGAALSEAVVDGVSRRAADNEVVVKGGGRNRMVATLAW